MKEKPMWRRFRRRVSLNIRAALNVTLAAMFVVGSWAGCALDQMAIGYVADALSGEGGSSVFTGENDPDLVGDALPFALKMYETLLSQVPEHRGLILSTGSAYIMYANAFVAGPAEFLPMEQFEQQYYQRLRAKNLYLRGRDMLLAGLDLKHPGLVASVMAGDRAALHRTDAGDVPYLYWIAAGWGGAFSIDPFDLDMALTIKQAEWFMLRAMELEPAFNSGAIYEFFIQFYGALPPDLGGGEDLARRYFDLAVATTGGTTPGPFVSLALSVSIANQDAAEFRELLGQALTMDPDADPQNRLANVLTLRRARWYLDHIETFFIEW